ncbi:MAG: hypothetical protein Q4P24_17435, partial [Rhodobacterales bacterium]|nr:hypothetical protein [Rhodobacterales bacterium]
MGRLLESVVEKCMIFGFVGGTDAAVAGSTIEAVANRDRKGASHEVEKIWLRKEQVQRPAEEFLARLAEDDLPAQPGPKHKLPRYISETDPDVAWALKDGPSRFSYETNSLPDSDHGCCHANFRALQEPPVSAG